MGRGRILFILKDKNYINFFFQEGTEEKVKFEYFLKIYFIK